MAQDLQTYRRAANAALFGLVVQVVLTAVMALAGLAVQSPALYAATWQLAGGLPIWIVLLMLFHQHRLERAEALEAEQLARAETKSNALFNEAADDLRIARRRLDSIYRVGMGIAGLVTAAYLLTLGGIYFYKALTLLQNYTLVGEARNDVSPIAAAVACIAIVFVGFIVARYESGMTRIAEYQALRGGAGFLMGNALVAFLLAVGLAFSAFENDGPLGAMCMVVPGVMILQGLEVLFNFLLNVYRPRRPGEHTRAAFDSRILGLLTSPKSLAKALSDAINYQFGFEVSSSWFYRLLGKAVTPLFLLGLAVLLAMTSIVLVQPQEQALVLRSGRIIGEPLGPGLHFKLPWPFDTTQKFDIGRVQQISVGSARGGFKTDEASGQVVSLLWTTPHSKEKEEYLLTAPTPFVDDQNSQLAEGIRVPPVSMVGLQMNVQYRIHDLLAYVRNNDDPLEMLTSLSEQLLCDHLALRDIDTIIGQGRIHAGDELRDKVQAAADRAGLGLQVILVTLEGVHPPSEKQVAESFQGQVSALQQKQSAIEIAGAYAIRALAEVSGSTERARGLLKAIGELSDAENELNALRAATPQNADAVKEKERQVASREQEVEELFAGARGNAAKLIYEARAYRWERAITQRAKADRFSSDLLAYRNAPEYYRMRSYLQVLAEGMAGARKIVTTVDNQTSPTFDIDLTDAQSTVESLMKPK
ncbi:MAG: hypothetical protein K8S99_14830 [Planctomycetes bacterium]|nr:hypothetical protein [Planctomycetota bacterium]